MLPSSPFFMSFNEKEQSRAFAAFLRSAQQDLNAAAQSVFKVAASKIDREVKAQLRSNFKRGKNSSGSFFKAVRTYNLSPRGSLGPASFVRLPIKFMQAFEEGATVTGKASLIILLPPGEQLGFKRISKGNSWQAVWSRIKDQSYIKKVGNGWVILYKDNEKSYPIYKIQKAVRLPKKINFYDTAERIAASIPDEISRLLK
jgi:hypothetical protein